MSTQDPSVIYDTAFFAETISYRHQYVALANCLHALFGGRRSVFDVGCGAGLMITRLQELGHEVCGIDGSSHAFAVAPKEIETRIAQRDITSETLPHIRADVVVCTEVAEHLAAEHADTLVDFVTASALQMIVWSAAPPGQGGVDHVNEQPPEYWLERFRAKGWEPEDVTTKALRVLMVEWKAQHMYCAANFYVLTRETAAR